MQVSHNQNRLRCYHRNIRSQQVEKKTLCVPRLQAILDKNNSTPQLQFRCRTNYALDLFLCCNHNCGQYETCRENKESTCSPYLGMSPYILMNENLDVNKQNHGEVCKTTEKIFYAYLSEKLYFCTLDLKSCFM